MAKQIVVLEQRSGSPPTWIVLFWFPVKPAQQTYRAKPGAKSAWKFAAQEEHDAIAAGQVFEVQATCEQAEGVTIGQLGANLLARYNAMKAQFDADPWGSYYGTNHDGVSWTVDQSKA